MMEMQDTINELQRELAALGRASSRMRQASDNGAGQVNLEEISAVVILEELNSLCVSRDHASNS